jgi:hypothetical protein
MSGDHTKYHGTAEVVKDKGEEHMKLCIYIVYTLILVVAIGYYVAHVWTDCLQEHSFLTCMRMLAR